MYFRFKLRNQQSRWKNSEANWSTLMYVWAGFDLKANNIHLSVNIVMELIRWAVTSRLVKNKSCFCDWLFHKLYSIPHFRTFTKVIFKLVSSKKCFFITVNKINTFVGFECNLLYKVRWKIWKKNIDFEDLCKHEHFCSKEAFLYSSKAVFFIYTFLVQSEINQAPKIKRFQL